MQGGGGRSGARVTVLGVAVSHPSRVVDATTGTTKLDLVPYCEAVAPAMLPHVRGRPLTLVHCPAGLSGPCRYMKHSKVWVKSTGGVGLHIVVPIAPRHDGSLCLAFARGLAATLSTRDTRRAGTFGRSRAGWRRCVPTPGPGRAGAGRGCRGRSCKRSAPWPPLRRRERSCGRCSSS